MKIITEDSYFVLDGLPTKRETSHKRKPTSTSTFRSRHATVGHTSSCWVYQFL